MANLVPGGRGAEKPRVFLWEAAAAAVRVVGTAEEPWFVAKDVCAALGHSNSRMALQRLDDDEKGVRIVYTLGGEQETAVISESGLFALVLTSRLPSYRVFRKWVTSEVLPQIRKTGAYAVPAALPEPRQIVIHETFEMPDALQGEDQMVYHLILEVLSVVGKFDRRPSTCVHGHTIADIARRDGAFSAWFGPRHDFQANARFFKNLSRWFGRPLYESRQGYRHKHEVIHATVTVCGIEPMGTGRSRRYILTKKEESVIPSTVRIPSPQAVALVDAALKSGGEVALK